MTGKVNAGVRGQSLMPCYPQQRIAPRGKSYDGTGTQRAAPETSSVGKYAASSSLSVDLQAGRSTYVSPSELQSASRNLCYPMDQPRSNTSVPYASESSPNRLPSESHNRGQYIPGAEYDASRNSSSATYVAPNASACRKSPPRYSPSRVQSERHYHQEAPRQEFQYNNPVVHGPSKSVDLMRMPLTVQSDKVYARELKESSPVRNSALYSSGRSEDSRDSPKNGSSKTSPKESPTGIRSPVEAVHRLNSEVYAKCMSSSVTSALASQEPRHLGSPGYQAPRITSLPPGVTSGVAGPVFLDAGVPVIQRPSEPELKPRQQQQQPIPMMKPIPGKGLLPYNVTPPKPSVIYCFIYFVFHCIKFFLQYSRVNYLLYICSFRDHQRRNEKLKN